MCILNYVLALHTSIQPLPCLLPSTILVLWMILLHLYVITPEFLRWLSLILLLLFGMTSNVGPTYYISLVELLKLQKLSYIFCTGSLAPKDIPICPLLMIMELLLLLLPRLMLSRSDPHLLHRPSSFSDFILLRIRTCVNNTLSCLPRRIALRMLCRVAP